MHGEDALCSEYFPSKMYEYLWMQRPILAVVHRNPQMAALLRGQGHDAVLSGESADDRAAVAHALAAALEQLFARWQSGGLPDSGQASPDSTEAAVTQLLGWVHQLPKAAA